MKNCNEVVRVFTDCLNVNGFGDFVRCSDCGNLMLIQIGGTACECESENLQWALDDKKYQEMTVEQLKEMGYIIEEVA